MSRETDVPASIAGFYYQLLLACKELTILACEENTEIENKVGIERGADIKIIKKNGIEISIEVKFYKEDSFSKNDYPIVHTIYNFHESIKAGKNSSQYKFTTNVKLNDNNFFINNWPKDDSATNFQTYINYVKECVIRESKDKSDFKKSFVSFINECKTNGICTSNNDDSSFYFKRLLEYLNKNTNEYSTYCTLLDDNQIKEFIKKMKFTPSGRNKFEEINDVKVAVYNNLKAIVPEFDDEACNLIMNKVMEDLFMTTVDKEKSESDINKDGLISVGNLHQIIDQYKQNKCNFKNSCLASEQVAGIIDTIEAEINRFNEQLKQLDNFDSDEKDRLRFLHIKVIEKLYAKISLLGNDNDSLKRFKERYSLEIDPPSSALTNLSTYISVLSACIENLDCRDVEFSEEIGINSLNNFILNENDKFCYKELNSANIISFNQLLGEFITNTIKRIEKIAGNEKIVFACPSIDDDEEPCKFNRDNIRYFIDQAKVGENFNLHYLFYNMEFKCHSCLKLSKKKSFDKHKETVRKFYVEGCK